jgi:hypothetical protein
MIEHVEIEKAECLGQELRLITVVVSSKPGLRTMRTRLAREPFPLGKFTPDAMPPSLQRTLNDIDG